MLTDTLARDLLHAAGASIEVTPSGPIAARPRRPLWPMVAAAAAVLLVIGLTALILRPSGDPTPAEPAPPDDRTFRLGPDQVPSVFGYSTEDAADMLEERGFYPLVSDRTSGAALECEKAHGRAVGTWPEIGTIVEPGSEILVLTSGESADSASAFCGVQPRREEAWAFLDFANGRGPAPEFAEQVQLYSDGQEGPSLTGDERADPDAWEACSDGVTCVSPLDAIREASARVQRERYRSSPMSFQSPFLGTRLGRESQCGVRPSALADRQGLELTLGVPPIGRGPQGGCTQVSLFYDAAGRIDAVHVVDWSTDEQTPGPPDVVGNTVTDARSRLEDLGYTVEEVPRADCSPVGLVISQAPGPWEYRYDSGPVALAVVDEVGPCSAKQVRLPSSTSRPTDAFVAWSRGSGQHPAFADEVRYLVNDGLIRKLTPEEATTPDRWTICFSGIPLPCQSPVRTLRSYDGLVVQSATPATFCVDRRGLSDAAAAALARDRMVRLDRPEAGACEDAWAIEIWINDDEEITAVNMLSARPTTD